MQLLLYSNQKNTNLRISNLSVLVFNKLLAKKYSSLIAWMIKRDCYI